jgi:hypothetical protein
MSTGWKRLTRGDLAKFDDTATEVILTAMDRGGIGRISNRGHATIRHPDGVRTMSVTADSSIRKAHNMRGDLRKLFPEPATNGATEDKDTAKESTMQENHRRPTFTDAELPQATNGAVADVILCPANKCDAVFTTPGARYAHIRDLHVTCEWPGCADGPDGTAYVGRNKQAVGGHVQVAHKGAKPWLQRDPSKRHEIAKKASATKQRNREARLAAEAAAAEKLVEATTVPVASTEPELVPTEPRQVTATPEHRGLPSAAVTHKPMTAAAKLKAIREILGEDPHVAQLEARVAELQAHLDLVREAVGLDEPKKK